jgi:hypothetical protein
MRISQKPSPLQIMIDQEQLKNVDYFNCLGNMISFARCTHEIQSRIAIAKAAFSRKNTLFTNKLDLNLWKKLVKCYIWSIALYDNDARMLQKVDHKCLEKFKVWCCRRIKKISWTNHVRNEDVLHRLKEKRNILHTIKRRKATSIGHSCIEAVF